MNDTVGREFLFSLLLLTRLRVLMLVGDRRVLVIVSDPVYDGTGKDSSQDHRSIEDAECLWPRTLLRKSLNGQNQNWEYYRNGEWHQCQHYEIQLRPVVDEYEEELGACVQGEADEGRELHAQLVDYESTDCQTVN